MDLENLTCNDNSDGSLVIRIPEKIEYVPPDLQRNDKGSPLFINISGPPEYVKPPELRESEENIYRPRPLPPADIIAEMLDAHKEPAAHELRPRVYPDYFRECGGWLVDRRILWHGDLESSVWSPVQSVDELQGILAAHGWLAGDETRSILNHALADKSLRQYNPFAKQNAAEISFSDGIFDVVTGKFRDRCLTDHCTYRLALDYASCIKPWRLDAFVQVVETLAGSTAVALRLQELCGVALSAAPAGDLLLVTCENRRWAALFPKLLTRVVDSDYASFLSLRDHDKSFRTADALGKHLLLSFMEGEAVVRDLETVLKLVDGDGINADRKYLPNIDFLAKTTLFCAGRRLPRVRDSSFADALDFVVRVELGGIFPEEVMPVSSFLSCEAAFVSWAIVGLRRYLERGQYTAVKTDDEDAQETLQEFLSTAVIREPNSSVSTADLLLAYEEFCESRESRKRSRYDLLQAIRENFGLYTSTVRVSNLSGGSKTCSGYRGIKLRVFNDDEKRLFTQRIGDDEDDVQDNDPEFAVEFEFGSGLLGEDEGD